MAQALFSSASVGPGVAVTQRPIPVGPSSHHVTWGAPLSSMPGSVIEMDFEEDRKVYLPSGSSVGMK